MNAAWSHLVTWAAGNPVGVLAAAGVAAVAAWTAHLRHLRARERDWLLVAGRSAEAEAVSRPVSVPAVLPARGIEAEGVPPAGGWTPAGRVLVIDDRPDERQALAALLDEFGVTPVFADSAWAATVAASEASNEGAPYEIVLVGAGVEGLEGGGVRLPDHVDEAAIERLLAAARTASVSWRAETSVPAMAG